VVLPTPPPLNHTYTHPHTHTPKRANLLPFPTAETRRVKTKINNTLKPDWYYPKWKVHHCEISLVAGLAKQEPCTYHTAAPFIAKRRKRNLSRSARLQRIRANNVARSGFSRLAQTKTYKNSNFY
jgi:hypothetical protein